MLRCLSLDDSREIWRNSYAVVIADSHGFSRTIPAVVGDCVVTLGPKCQLACWDAATGKSRWLIDLVLEHGATVPSWYAGQCPFIDTTTDRLIVAPGGAALVMAIDYHTGKIIWQSPNPHKWTMTHVSITPMEFAAGGCTSIAAAGARQASRPTPANCCGTRTSGGSQWPPAVAGRRRRRTHFLLRRLQLRCPDAAT